MSVTSTYLSCPKMQRDLNRYFTERDPTRPRQAHEVSLVEFLRSPTNTDGIIQNQLSPGGGKTRQVEVRYRPRISEKEVNDSRKIECTPTKKLGKKSKLYQIDTTAGSQFGFQLDLTDIKDGCENNELYIAETLADAIDGLIRNMEAQTVDELITLSGKFGEGETNTDANNEQKTVRTQKSGSTDLSYDMLEEVSFAARNAGYPSVPYIFGWNEAWKYMRRIEAGCCANDGVNVRDLERQYDQVMIANSRIDSAMGAGDNEFMTVGAGAVQLVTWNQFVGANGVDVVDDESYKQTVIRDPRTGIPIDLLMQIDCSNGGITWHFNLTVAHELKGLPSDMFQTGDRYDGVTYVNKFIIDNS